MKKLTFLFLFLGSIIVQAQDDFVYPMGIKSGTDQIYESMPQKATLTRNFYTRIADKASLKQYAPTPKSQGNFGTCVAWAVSYSARTILEAQRNNWSDQSLINSNAFTPAFQYRLVEPDNANCRGAYTGEAVETLKTVGALPLKFWKRTGDENLCPQQRISTSLVDIAGDYKISEFTKLFNSDFNDKSKTDKAKLSLSNGNPVVISMICPTSFHHVTQGLWEPEEDPQFGDHGRHAMTVVAYDDDKHGGAFLFQNSWGSSYGDGGFVWVKYADFNNFVYQAIELVQMPKLAPEEPIYKGSLSIVNTATGDNIELELAEKFRNWNTILESAGAYTYKAKAPLKSGTSVRILLNNDQPAFAYILGTGSVNTSVQTLFPVEGLSAALNYRDNEVALPNENGAFVMDDTVGKDYMILLLSREPIDIAELTQKLDGMEGDFSANLKETLGDQLIPFDDVDFAADTAQFEAKHQGDDTKIMAMIIAYDHIK